MAIIKCPECGHQVSDKAATCPSCGIEIAGRVMKCPECGATVFKDQELCPNCHYPLHEAPRPDAPEQDVTEYDPTPSPMGTEQPQRPAGKTEPEQPAEEEKPRKKGGYIAVVVSVVIVLAVAFVAIYFYKNSQRNSESDAYAEAMLSNEPSVLQNYLDIYTDAPSEHRDSIQAHLTLLMNIDKEWTDALVSGSKTAIERYLKMHPNSPHATEGKIKIDSLDWVAALQTNTAEAFQTYMDNHSDGLYYDEAKDKFDKLDAQQVTPDDKSFVSTTFSSYFRALAAGDEDALTATLANVMDSFLKKTSATKNDVVSYMHKLHAKAGDSPIEFRTNNDWKITKSEAADGSGYEFAVDFSVDQKTTSEEGSVIETYQVDAKISSDGKISTLNMKRMVQ